MGGKRAGVWSEGGKSTEFGPIRHRSITLRCPTVLPAEDGGCHDRSQLSEGIARHDPQVTHQGEDGNVCAASPSPVQHFAANPMPPSGQLMPMHPMVSPLTTPSNQRAMTVWGGRRQKPARRVGVIAARRTGEVRSIATRGERPRQTNDVTTQGGYTAAVDADGVTARPITSAAYPATNPGRGWSSAVYPATSREPHRRAVSAACFPEQL